MPPLAESPSPPVPIASPVVPTPDPSPSVAMATTTVQTQGGILVLYAENGVVAVDRAAPEQGFTTRSLPGYDGSLLFQFVSAKHVSEVFAYVDANYITQFSIDERDL
jgi:hypothetical protein